MTGAPNDLPAESVFSVDEFVISSEGVEIARIAETSYLYRIPEDEIDPADETDTMLPFVVEVVYSDINIKDNLNTTSSTSVAVPNGAWQWDAICSLSRPFCCVSFHNGKVIG